MQSLACTAGIAGKLTCSTLEWLILGIFNVAFSISQCEILWHHLVDRN